MSCTPPSRRAPESSGRKRSDGSNGVRACVSIRTFNADGEGQHLGLTDLVFVLASARKVDVCKCLFGQGHEVKPATNRIKNE
eukprot:3758730-Rhodomonas_salina.4